MMPPKKGSPEGMKARFAKAAMQDMGEEPEAMEEESPQAEGAEDGLKSAVKAAMDAGMTPKEIRGYVDECCGDGV